MEIIERVTLEQVREAKPAMIYYGANTCWWTHDPNHLSRTTGVGLPCDPRGGVLFETDDIEGFLKAAERNAQHYGRHGLRAFMAAHHLNCILSLSEPRPWCSPDWLEYNEALDALDQRNRHERSDDKRTR